MTKIYKFFESFIWLKRIRIVKNVRKISVKIVCLRNSGWLMRKIFVFKNAFAVSII